MTVTEIETSPSLAGAGARAPVVNDFSISAATKNGSGSQTANTTLLRAPRHSARLVTKL